MLRATWEKLKQPSRGVGGSRKSIIAFQVLTDSVNHSDSPSEKPCDFTPMWDLKLIATNEQDRLMEMDNSLVVTVEKGGYGG